MMRFDDHELEVPKRNRDELRRFAGREVILGIRPEDLEDASLVDERADGGRMRVKVEMREALGSSILLHFRVAASAKLDEDIREVAGRMRRLRVATATRPSSRASNRRAKRSPAT